MISNTVISKKKPRVIPWGWAAFRTFKGLVQPVLVMIAIFCALISLFEPMEGTNSRLVMRLVCAGALAFIGVMVLIDKLQAKRDLSYKMYVPKIEREMQPGSFLLMLLLCVIVLVPLYIVVITSLKTPQEANNVDFTWTITQGVTTEGYEELFLYGEVTGIYMSRALLNSLLLAVFPPLLSLLISAAAAFMFAQGKFRAKKQLYRAMIITMLLPGCMTQAASILMWDQLHLMGTPVPLFIGCFFGSVGTVMFLREYMSSLAKELFESAEIDGAGRIRQYFNVVLPIARPALTGQFILGFIGGFNDYMGPLIYIHDPQWYTVQIALDFMNTGNLNNSVLTAGCVIVTVPMLCVYLAFHKKILASVQISSGLKG